MEKPIKEKKKSESVEVKKTIPSIYPDAVQYPKKMKERGEYHGGMRGAVVHFTAGNTNATSGADTVELGIRNGYTYLTIDPKGIVYQAHNLNQWGYHCGESKWEGLGKGLSDQLIGIEICCAGKLKEVNGKYYSWFNKEIPVMDVRQSDKNYQGEKGFYQKYSPKQEASLIKLLLWLKDNFPAFSFDYVLGHDEVSPGRKNDPGASLSMPMPEFRELLKTEYNSQK